MTRTLKLMWQTQNTQTGTCPAIYEVDGGYVVQGKILAPGELAQLVDHGFDETAVFVNADVLDRLRERDG